MGRVTLVCTMEEKTFSWKPQVYKIKNDTHRPEIRLRFAPNTLGVAFAGDK